MLEESLQPLARDVALLIGLASIAFLTVIALIEFKVSRLNEAADAKSVDKLFLITVLGLPRLKGGERGRRSAAANYFRLARAVSARILHFC